MNGWYSYGHQENTIFKINVIENLRFDAIFLSETFCKGDDTFTIPGFKVVQYNRKSISRRSIRGSGGVAIAISNNLLCNHDIVTVYRGREDGILAVKLRCRDNDALIGLLANYLSPDSYRFGKDPESYFNDNSLVFSDLSDCDLLVAGGDLNSRTRTDPDFIADIDGHTAPRQNPDKDKNSHGDFFLNFLKDNRALICNGRITPELNDFTFINPRGCSMPDYIYCPADHIQYCSLLQVIKVSDVINFYNLPVPSSLPDHSILVAEFDIKYVSYPTQKPPSASIQNKKVKKIFVKFMTHFYHRSKLKNL